MDKSHHAENANESTPPASSEPDAGSLLSSKPSDDSDSKVQEQNPPSAAEKIKNDIEKELEDWVTWEKFARTIAGQLGHTLYRNYVFSDSIINEVSEHILCFGVTLMKKKYDPAQGTKETTFLYRIMAGLAKDEYRRIAGERRRQKKAGVREVVKDPDFWETNYPLSCAGLKEVEQNDTFRQYSTVQNSEVKQLKRQYLPSSLRYLSEKELQERLSAIDREIIDRLVAGEKLTDIRKDFESRPENGSGSVGHRKFFESRRKAIIGRAGLEEPESWSRHDTPMKIVRLGEEQERRRKRGEAQRARRERKKFMEHGDARAQKRLHDSDNIEVEQHLLLPSVKGT